MIPSESVTKFLRHDLTSAEQAAIEENAVALGLSRRLMMENAGAAVARIILSRFDVVGKRVCVVAGTGNNGGDGFVAARHIADAGAKVDVILLGNPTAIRTEEARGNWSVLASMGVNLDLRVVEGAEELEALEESIGRAALVVDAILGTGVKGRLREPLASAVRRINEVNVPVMAVDVPSGLDPDTGEIAGDAIRATHTITFHRRKTGMARAADRTGEVTVVDIGIPVEAELQTGPGDVRQVVKPRRMFSHKWDYGMVLIVGGSDLYSGAPALAALSALRSGAGMAVVAAPECVAGTIRSFSPSLIVRPLEGTSLTSRHVKELDELMGRCGSAVVGPGLDMAQGTAKATIALLTAMAKRRIPTVVDAGALRFLRDRQDLLRQGTFVLTPHAGEFERLTGQGVPERWFERVEGAVGYAKKCGSTLLLKGHETVITDGDRLKVDIRGTPVLATGGSGDVLSGIIGTFLAWKADAFRAASAATYVLGSAGRLAQGEKGFHIIASDLVEKLPAVLAPFDVQRD